MKCFSNAWPRTLKLPLQAVGSWFFSASRSRPRCLASSDDYPVIRSHAASCAVLNAERNRRGSDDLRCGIGSFSRFDADIEGMPAVCGVSANVSSPFSPQRYWILITNIPVTGKHEERLICSDKSHYYSTFMLYVTLPNSKFKGIHRDLTYASTRGRVISSSVRRISCPTSTRRHPYRWRIDVEEPVSR